MNYRILVLLSFLFCQKLAYSQQYLGLHSSNYSGITGLTINPGNIADNRYALDINMATLSLNLNNSYVGLRDGFLGAAFRQDTGFVNSYFDERMDSKVLMNSIYFNTEASVLSFMINAGNQGFGLDVRMRNYLNIDNLSDTLAHAIVEEMIYPSIYGIPQKHDGFSVQNHLWGEAGFIYGRVVREGEHFIKVGTKPKLIFGLSSAYLYSEALDITLESDSTMSLSDSYISYGHSKNLDGGINNYVFDGLGKMSFGIDIGAVYEWRPKSGEFKYDMNGETDLPRKDQNKYKAKFSFSLLDLGYIRYEKGDLSHDFNPLVNDWDYKDLSLSNVYDFDDTLKNRFPTLSNKGIYNVPLPTTLVLMGDYHIWKDFYINATLYHAFKYKNRITRTHNYSTYSITPRWDWKWFGLYIPFSYNEYDQWNMGASAMIGPFIVGTQSILPAFTDRTVTGMDFFFGIKVSSLYFMPSDRDGDKVSDDIDECIDVPGLWVFKGCPDTDGDGIVDSEDVCPKVPGLPELKGCPDTDGDGVKDSADECPEVAGLKELDGCPDRDGDGIKDDDDDCPDNIGLLEFNGCPDKDGDKVIDKLDLCPDKPGAIEQKGCPDSDKDGLFDHEDNCIETPGPIENQGCPDKDKDGDGVIDRKDDCPEEPGPAKNKGCPLDDTDEDGVLDEVDDCPKTPGPSENNGCPIIEEEEEEILNTAFNNLEFESGNAVIKAESYVALNELAVLLKKKTEWKLKLTGHTDNVGAAQNNLQLSKDRAESVKTYLEAQEINTSRINVEYYGETKPVADNDTPEGRQQNRRVEMEVIFE